MVLVTLLILLSGGFEIFFSYKFIVFYFIVCFATILPDVDSKDSFIKKEYPLLSRILYIIIFLINLPIFLIFLLTKKGSWRDFFRHRGFFHTIFGAVSVSVLGLVLISFIDLNVAILVSGALFFGYVAHLIEDSFTKHGVAWFWPLFETKARLPLVTTGTRSELLFNIAILLLSVAMVLLMLYANARDQILNIVEKYNPSSVLLEAPDGLKPLLKLLSSDLKKLGIKVYINAGHCYGPCDIGIVLAEKLNIDLIIHIGHNGEVIGYKDFNLKRE